MNHCVGHVPRLETLILHYLYLDAPWIIARLGGWSGYHTQKPPGIPTLVRGLRLFQSLFQGWKLALG